MSKSNNVKFFKLVDWAEEAPDQFVVAKNEDEAIDQASGDYEVQAFEIDFAEYEANA